MIGEYVDDAAEGQLVTPGRSESLFLDAIPEVLEVAGRSNGVKTFTIILRDQRAVRVRGAGLKYLQHPSNSADSGSYAILATKADNDIFVALFPVSEVKGIFSGEMLPARESA